MGNEDVKKECVFCDPKENTVIPNQWLLPANIATHMLSALPKIWRYDVSRQQAALTFESNTTGLVQNDFTSTSVSSVSSISLVSAFILPVVLQRALLKFTGCKQTAKFHLDSKFGLAFEWREVLDKPSFWRIWFLTSTGTSSGSLFNVPV